MMWLQRIEQSMQRYKVKRRTAIRSRFASKHNPDSFGTDIRTDGEELVRSSLSEYLTPTAG